IVEQQVRFVEEEYERRLVGIANLRQLFEQLRQHPEQKRGVELRRTNQLFRGQDIDHSAALAVGLQQVVDVEHRLAEELIAALLLNLQQPPLNRADRRRRDVAVLGRELTRVVADKLQHGPQILQIQQQQSRVVRNLEHQRQHAFLHRVPSDLAA